MDNSVKKEEVNEEIKPEVIEEPKDNKPEVKLSSWKSVVALIFLFAFILVGILSMFVIRSYQTRPSGVLDIDEVNKQKPLLGKDIIESLNSDTKTAVFNYLMLDLDTDTKEEAKDDKEKTEEEPKEESKEEPKEEMTFAKFLNSLSNNRKLILADIEDGKTLDDIKKTLTDKFNSDLEVKGSNLSVTEDGEKKDIYIFNKEKNSFFINSENKGVKLEALPLEGVIIDYEYDDVKTLEDGTFEVVSYSLFETHDGDNITIDNKQKNLVPLGADISVEELRDVLKERYADHKEEYNVITYTLEKSNDKYYVKDVTVK